jgi:hypothetical protein
MINYSQILNINYPTAQWSINNEDYDTLQWYSDTPKPTQEELDALWPSTEDELAKKDCKKQAQEILYKTDWTTIADVADPIYTPYLMNQEEFKQYRAIIRNYAVNPVPNPEWPTQPTEQWSS